MAIQVTPKQYQRLTEARDNWPEYLTPLYGLENPNPRVGCAVTHLLVNAGITKDEMRRGVMHREGFRRISEVYGLSLKDISAFSNKSFLNYLFADESGRARKMLGDFEKILSRVEVMPDYTIIETPKSQVDNRRLHLAEAA